MNVAVHQNSKKNEKARKKETGEKTDDRFWRKCCHSEGSTTKKCLVGGKPRVSGILGAANNHFNPNQ